MSYCNYCGREETHGHCVCLRTNPIPRWHVWIIYAGMIMVPVIVLTLIKHEQSIWDINYLFFGGLVLVGILLLITLASNIFKQPYLALFFGCHQSKARSITIRQKVLPLCARCTGIYLGTIFFPIVMYLDYIPFYVYLILGLPMIIDGLLQRFLNVSSTNPRRLITGFLFGSTLITLFSLYQAFIIWLVELILDWL